MMAPPRSRRRSRRPRRHASTRVTGTDPVSERMLVYRQTRRRHRSTRSRGRPTSTTRHRPKQQHRDEAEQAPDVPDEQREAGALRFDELRRSGRDQNHENHRRKVSPRRPQRWSSPGRSAVLLPDEHRAHQRPEHDQPGAGDDPNDAARGDVQVEQRPAARRGGRRRRSVPRPTANGVIARAPSSAPGRS